jgi:multidrug efflux system membrane fusion protein
MQQSGEFTEEKPALRPKAPPPPPPTRGTLLRITLILSVIIVGLLSIGFIPRLLQVKDLKEAHDETVGAIPVVHTIIAKPADHSESITLPGNIGAIQYTTIYARVDGYLKDRFVDIGDTVKAGQLLAVIDTPTVDQKLAQAKADLAKAQAALETAQAQLKEAMAKDKTAWADIEKNKGNVEFATVTANRWTDLAERGAVSYQSRDEKVRTLITTTAELEAAKDNEAAAAATVKAAQSTVKEARAGVVAQQANVGRLVAEQGFQKVIAPFDGVITERKVDPGALITQGSQSSNLELFQLAKIDTVRIYVSVPQRLARYLSDGMTANVSLAEFPDKKFVGTVTNVSGALDPSTRTRQTEIKVANPGHEMLPGMYAEVNLSTLRDAPWIRVAGTTLLTRTDGQYVVVVKDGRVHYQKITIGRDFGNEVEVRTGLQGSELVVVSPDDSLQEGEKVQPLPASATDSKT